MGHVARLVVGEVELHQLVVEVVLHTADGDDVQHALTLAHEVDDVVTGAREHRARLVDHEARGLQILAEVLAQDEFPGSRVGILHGAMSREERFRAYDDFERMPLHALVLIDADGKVRWQDFGAEPFRDVDWLLTESQRLLGLPAGALQR